MVSSPRDPCRCPFHPLLHPTLAHRARARPPLRWRVRLCGAVDRHLLPALLRQPPPPTRTSDVLPDPRGGRTGRLPSVPALPARPGAGPRPPGGTRASDLPTARRPPPWRPPRGTSGAWPPRLHHAPPAVGRLP